MRPGETTWRLREIGGDRWLRHVTGAGDRPFTSDRMRALTFTSEAAASAMARRLGKSLWKIHVEAVSDMEATIAAGESRR